MLRSAIYHGSIRHRRFTPVSHQFNYRLFMMYIDLDELDQVINLSSLWSYNSRNLVEFRRSDYLGDVKLSIKQAVKQIVSEKTGDQVEGPICMLSNLRYWGQCFNPVSFYICYDLDQNNPTHIVAEVNNTPWNERHAYVLKAPSVSNNPKGFKILSDKDFHVSPYMPMSMQYVWHFIINAARIRIHINCTQQAHKVFDATLNLQRQDLNTKTAALVPLRYPLLCARILQAIYYQAFRLWLKKTPFYPHP